MRIIRELLEFKPHSKKTDLTEALKYLSNVMKKKAIVFILSDFMMDGYERTMKIVGNKHDVTGIRVYDPNEENIINLGMVQLEDAETGAVHVVNTHSKKVRMRIMPSTGTGRIILRIRLPKREPVPWVVG